MKQDLPKGAIIAIIVAAIVVLGGVGFFLTKDAGNPTGPGLEKEIEQANAAKARYEGMQDESKAYGRPAEASHTGAGR